MQDNVQPLQNKVIAGQPIGQTSSDLLTPVLQVRVLYVINIFFFLADYV
jgi:hypothetical protein